MNTSIVTRMEPAQDLPQVITPMGMLEKAVSQGASIEVIERMMALQERWQANEARKAFDAAISAAKAEIPAIVKNAKGHNDKTYANFAAIAKAIDPIITRHGLSYRFRTKQDGAIHVTCVLSHVDGHSEENTLAGPSDGSGSKNAIQAIGSTLTYLQRYSLIQALGLASEDDDGKASNLGEPITEEQAADLLDLISEVAADKAKFLAFMKIDRLGDLPAKRYAEACTMLNSKRARP